MKKEVVYIASVKGGHCKVGRTSRPLIRESEIRSGLGVYSDVRMFAMFECEGISSKVENLAHKCLRNATATDGCAEIFPCSPEVAIDYVADALREIEARIGRRVSPAQLNKHIGPRGGSPAKEPEA